MIRLFAALAIPPEAGAALARAQTGVRAARWRPLDTLHVTLRFFGDVPETMAEDLDLELDRVDGRPLDLTIETVGVFGEGRETHALWAGVRRSAGLEQLARRCEIAARRAGLKPETRAYHAHVTLAYLRGAAATEIGAWIQTHSLLKLDPFVADRFGLYSSRPTSEGSRYTLERLYRLSGPAA